MVLRSRPALNCALPAVLVTALAVPAQSAAQVWKCTGARGAVVYQDTACPEGTELAMPPPSLSVIPLRPIPGSTTHSRVERPAKPAPAARKAAAVAGDAAERRYLHAGMHEGEVLARAGAPDMKSGGGGRKSARWTYLPAARDPQTLTTVVFEYGLVVDVERKVIR